MSIIAFIPQKKWSHRDDIISLREVGEMPSIMDSWFGTTSPKSVFAGLMEVKSQLAAAKAAVGGQPCNAQVTELVSGYHSLTHDCFVSSGTFVMESLKAMRIHKEAYDCVEDGYYQEAAAKLSKIHTVATKMIEESSNLEGMVTSLIDKTELALIAAVNDDTLREKEKQKLLIEIERARCEKTGLDDLIDSQELAVKTAREDEATIVSAASQQRDRAFSLEIVKSLVSGISSMNPSFTGSISAGAQGASASAAATTQAPQPQVDASKRLKEQLEARLAQETDMDVEQYQLITDQVVSLGSEISAASDQSMEAAKMAAQSADTLGQQEAAQRVFRQELEEKQRQSKSKKMMIIEQMKTMQFGKDDIQIAINGLRICQVTLGDIKVKLRLVKDFWHQIAECAKALEEMSKQDGDLIEALNDLENASEARVGKKRGKFDEALLQSVYLWAAIGIQCLEAEQGMLTCKKDADELMKKLPVGQQQSELEKYLMEAEATITG